MRTNGLTSKEKGDNNRDMLYNTVYMYIYNLMLTVVFSFTGYCFKFSKNEDNELAETTR